MTKPGGKPGASRGRGRGAGQAPEANPATRLAAAARDGGGGKRAEAGADRVPAAAGGPEQPRQGRGERGPAQGVAGREGAPGAGCRRKVEAGLAPAAASIFFCGVEGEAAPLRVLRLLARPAADLRDRLLGPRTKVAKPVGELGLTPAAVAAPGR